MIPAAFAIPVLASCAIVLFVDVWKEWQDSELVLLRAGETVRWSLYAMMVLAVIAVGFRPVSFIYFQF